MKRVKNLLFIALAGVMISSFFFSCNKDEKELLKFYRSQERDPGLIGWWKELSSNNNYTQYTVYCENGEVYTYSRTKNEDLWKNPSPEYWYTEDEILYIYTYKKHWTLGSFETSCYYSIEQDTLITAEEILQPRAIRVDPEN